MATYRLTAADRRALARMNAAKRNTARSSSYLAKSQTSGETVKKDPGVLTKIGHTVGDVGSDILFGVGKGIEGIVDFGASLVGLVGGLFDDGFEDNIKSFIETDWVGKVATPVDSYFEHSYTNGSKVGEIIEGAASGIGQMLPSVAITIATAGVGGAVGLGAQAATKLGQAAGLAALGASAAGTGAEEAYKDGASFEQGLGYGALSGATEVATERLLPGPADAIFGKTIFKKGASEVAEQGAKRTIKNVAKEAINEGFEEMASEATNPLRKTIYKGRDALEEYTKPEFYGGVLEAGATGALTSIGYSGTVGNIYNKAKGLNGDIDASISSIEKLNDNKARLQERGELNDASEAEIDAKIEQNLKQIEAVLGKSSASDRAKYIKNYELSGRFSEDGVLNAKAEDTSGLDKQYVSADARGQEERIKAALDKEGVTAYHGELSERGSEALKEVYKAHNALNKLGFAGKHVVIVNEMTDTNAYLDGDIIAIGKDMLENGEHIKKLVHETTHFTEGSKEWAQVADFVFGKDASKVKVNLAKEISAVLNGGYGITQADVDAVVEHIASGYETKLTAKQGELIEEVVANRMENMFGDSETIERICREKPSLAKRIWERIKALIDSLGQSSSEREEIKKLRETERLFRAALETGGQDYIRGEVENFSKAIDGDEDSGYNKIQRSRQAKYIDWKKLGMPIKVYVYGELEKIYKGIWNGVADEIAIEQGDIVYIVDSAKENGKVRGAVRRKFVFSDEKYRKEYIMEVNNDAVSKGKVSDELSSKIASKSDKYRRRNGGQESGEELSADQGESADNEGRVSEDNGDRGGVKKSKKIIDAEYLSAVESGDMETAQRMVDEAAAESVTRIEDEYMQVSEGDGYFEYDKPIEVNDVNRIHRIYAGKGEISINQFSSNEIKLTQKWAYKFYKELGVKSPFFRSWFGDWRQHDHKHQVPILSDVNKVGKNPRGQFKNNDTGWVISSSSVGYDETVSHSGKDKRSLIAMRNIDQIIENSILLDTEVSAPGRGKKSIYTAFMHKFYSIIRINGKPYLAKMAVDESYNPGKTETIKKFYHVRAIEIEPVSSVGIGFNHTPIIEDTSSTISIHDLFEIVKNFDEKFKPKSVNEHLIDKETGLPKVFYHGTRAEFDEFDTSKIGSSTDDGIYGKGFYFSSYRNQAEQYGKVGEYYLDVRKPLVLSDYESIEKLANRLNMSESNFSINNGIIKPRYAFVSQFTSHVKAAGFDGVIVDYGTSDEIIVFDPTQIKSATDNIGTFDRGTKKIRYSRKTDTAYESKTNLPLGAIARGDQLLKSLDAGGELFSVPAILEEPEYKGEIDAEEELRKAEIKYLKGELKEAEYKRRLENAIVFKAKRLKTKELEKFFNATEYRRDIFKDTIEQLGKIENQNNINSSGTRELIGELGKWYTEENPMLQNGEGNSLYDLEIADMIESVSMGKGKFTLDELKSIKDILSYFRKFMESYNTIVRNGKRIDAKGQAKVYIDIMVENRKLKVSVPAKVFRRYHNVFGEPMSVCQFADMYQRGFFTESLEEIREGAIDAANTQMRFEKKFETFFKRNKKYLKEMLKRTVDMRGEKLSLNQAIGLYMALGRKDSHAGFAYSGFDLIVAETPKETVRAHDKNVSLKNREATIHFAGIDNAENMSEAEIEEAIKVFRDSLYKQFSEADKTFISIAEECYKECGEAKMKTDMLRTGYSRVISDYYYPLRRTGITYSVDERDFFSVMHNEVCDFAFTKESVKGAKQALLIQPMTDVLERHINQVSLYTGLAVAIDNYNILYNMNVTGDQRNVRSIKSMGAYAWEGGNEYFKKLLKDLKVAVSADDPAILKQLYGGYVSFALGANPKVWFTQWSSYIAAFVELDAVSLLKGGPLVGNLSGVSGKDVDKYSRLSELRNYDNSAAMAQAVVDRESKVINKPKKLGEVLMKPIGWTDRMVIETLFRAAQIKVAKEQGLKLGSEENKIEAGKLLDRVILNTQQNALVTERSAAMRGSLLWRFFTTFSSDAMKLQARVVDAFCENGVLKKRRALIKADNTLSEAERAKRLKEIDNRLKASREKSTKVIATLFATSIYMYLIGMLFKLLYNKLDEEYEEKDAEGIAWDIGTTVFGNMVGGLPVIRDIVSRFTEGYEIDNYAYSSLNELLNSIETVYDTIINGKEEKAAVTIKNSINAIGQILGFPTRNIYNAVTGLIRRFSPTTGYKIDDFFYTQSYNADLKKAIENGDEDMIDTIIGLITEEKVGMIADTSVRKEMNKLSKAGYSVLPRSIGTSVTYDGEEIALTKKQQNRFKELYSAANEGAAKLVGSSLYNRADEEAKAKAIKFLYDTYYNLALQEVLDVDLESKNVLFAEAIDIEDLAIIYSIASGIEADKDRKGNVISGSRKAKIEKYVESLRMSAAEKYLVMGYLGYKCKNGADKVKAYVSRLNLTKDEKARLMEYCGYAA